MLNSYHQLDCQDLERRFASGESPNIEIDAGSGTLLIHEATCPRNQRDDVIRLVARFGGSLDAVDRDGNTPLHLALRHQSFRCFEALLQSGANPNIPDARGETVVHLAANPETLEFFDATLQHGGDCGRHDANGDTVLHLACSEEKVQIVQRVLRHAPELINAVGADGQTPLHIAASSGLRELFLLLLHHAADFAAADSSGATPIDIVLLREDSFLIESFGKCLVADISEPVALQPLQLLLRSEEARPLLLKLLRISSWQQPQQEQQQQQQQKAANPLEKPELLRELSAELRARKVDMQRILQLADRATQLQLLPELQEFGLIAAIAEQVLRHILLCQNVQLLLQITANSCLWSRVTAQLEADSASRLFRRILRQPKAGVKGLVRRRCADANEQGICPEKLSRFVSEIVGFKVGQQRACTTCDCSVSNGEQGRSLKEFEEQVGDQQQQEQQQHQQQQAAYRNPALTLCAWSVLTGRLRLAPLLLAADRFDAVPLGLLLSRLIRRLATRPDVEDLFRDKAELAAERCEAVAVDTLKSVKALDSSPGNWVTRRSLCAPLPEYGGHSTLQIGCLARCETFALLDIVGQARDTEWFGDFAETGGGQLMRQLLVGIASVPPLAPLLPPLLAVARAGGHRRYEAWLLAHHDVDHEALRRDAEAGGDGDGDSENAVVPAAAAAAASNCVDVKEQSVGYREGFGDWLRGMRRLLQLPCVQLRQHMLLQLVLLLAVCHVALVQNPRRSSGGVSDVFCCLAAVGRLLQLVRGLVIARSFGSCWQFASSGWSLLDASSALALLAAICCRWGDHFTCARLLLSASVLLLSLQLLQFAALLQPIGRKLLALSSLVRSDFAPLLCVAFLLSVAFGLTHHSLLPTSSIADSVRFGARGAFRALAEDSLIGADDSASFSEDTSDTARQVAKLAPSILSAMYATLVQLLLLTALIAMFGKTLDRVDGRADAMWVFARHSFGMRLARGSWLPPPLNLFADACDLLVVAVRKCLPPSCCQSSYKQRCVSNKLQLLFLFYQSLAIRRINCRASSSHSPQRSYDTGGNRLEAKVDALAADVAQVLQIRKADI